MPKVDLSRLPVTTVPGRASALLGALGAFEGRSVTAPFGMAHLGAGVETLAPGAHSSHRHWHTKVDEIVVVLEGELSLIEEGGPVPLQVGDIAVFPAGEPLGHCLRNDSAAPARFFVVSSQDAADRCHYADADLIAEADGTLRRADGTVLHAKEDTP